MRMVNLCKNKLFNTGLMLFLCLGLQAQNKEMRRVATNDCGVTNTQAFLIKGDDYTLPDSFTGSKEAKTCNFGGTVIYAFDQMDIQADYRMEVVYLADNRREQRIVADGNEGDRRTLYRDGATLHDRHAEESLRIRTIGLGV